MIPNARLGDERTYNDFLDGLPENSVIAVGTHGNTRSGEELAYMFKAIRETIQRLRPSRLLIYGSVPVGIAGLLDYHKIPYTVYKSDTGRVFARRKMIPAKEPLLPWDEQSVKEGA